MATHSCYLFQKGRLTTKDEAFYFESESLKRFIPPQSTEELHLFGAVEMNKRFFQLAKENNVQVHMYDHYTRYIGSFIDYQNNTNGEILVKQVQRQADEQKRLAIAQAILQMAGKQIIKNLKYYQNRQRCEQLGQAIHDITISLGRLEQVQTIQSAMLLEAHIRQVYYRCFDEIILNDDFPFERRSTRPPHNALNALISFGNTVLYNIVMNEIMRTKLDIRIGFLHETQNRRTTTLNLDLAEIFKPMIIDRLIFRLINRQQIKINHFKETSDGVGIYLNDTGRKIFITELEKSLQTTIDLPQKDRRYSYRQLIRQEAYNLQAAIETESGYQPFEVEGLSCT